MAMPVCTEARFCLRTVTFTPLVCKKAPFCLRGPEERINNYVIAVAISPF